MSKRSFQEIENVQCDVEGDDSIYLKASARLTAADARKVARELIEQSICLDLIAKGDPDKKDEPTEPGIKLRIPMQYIHFHARQDPKFDHMDEFAGADIDCWIKDQSQQNALIIAKGRIKKSGWLVNELVQHVEISSEDLEVDDVTFYEQALQDEEVFVYHIYSSEAE